MEQRLRGKGSMFTHAICLSILLFLFVSPAFSINIDQLNLISGYKLDDSGYSATMALHPKDGSLHVAWVTRFGDIKYSVRNFNGSWSYAEMVPDGGNNVFGMEHANYRPCLDMTIDRLGVTHMVFGTESGDLYYVKGRPNNWQTPVRLVDKEQYTIYPGIESVRDHLYVVYEDSSPDDSKSYIHTMIFNGSTWSEPERHQFGEYSRIARGSDDRVYIIYRGPWSGHVGKDIWFGSLKYGEDTWSWKNPIVDPGSGISQGPDLVVYNKTIYIAWADAMEETDPEYNFEYRRCRLLLAKGKEPGINWTPRIGSSKGFDNTDNPHSRVAAYSDGTLLYMNGSRNERYWLCDGDSWSAEREAPWNNGDIWSGRYIEVICDGRTAWITKEIGEPGKLEIFGIVNPNAEVFNPPEPDAVDDLEIIATETVGEDGYSGDLCVDPLSGVLWASWISLGKIYQKNQPVSGSWGGSSMVPIGDITAHGDEYGWLRPCLAMTVDLQGRRHLAFGDENGNIHYMMHNGEQWSNPVQISVSSSSAIHLHIASTIRTVTVVYEDAAANEIYSVHSVNGVWQTPVKVSDGEYPDMVSGSEGRLFLSSISMDAKRTVQLSDCIPGFTSWRTKTAITPVHSIGGGPALIYNNNNLYIAYSNNTGAELSDYKSELFCASSMNQGSTWDTQFGTYGPVYYENTADPHPRAAVYSDGQILLLNGRRLDGRFAIYNGNIWSKTRSGHWGDGIGRVACDGRVVWHIVSTTDNTHSDVTVTGIKNSNAVRYDFNNHPPFYASPETIVFAPVNQPFQLSFVSMDVSGRPLSYTFSSMTPLRSGMQLQSASKSFVWSPKNVDLSADPWQAGAGKHLVGITAKTASGQASTFYFWIQVVESNTAPHITTLPITEVQALSLYSLDIDAEDADQDPLTFSLLNFPSGMQIQGASGLITWMPAKQDAGDHDVSVRVSDNFGGEDTLHYVLTVSAISTPIASFSSDYTDGIVPLTIHFSDSSEGTITSWHWDFGDLATSAEQHPIHLYEIPGTYAVQLIVTGPGGTDTLSVHNCIEVRHQSPEAAFGADIKRGQYPLAVQFKDSSKGAIQTWQWNFGDNISSTLQNPAHTFQTPGWYSVTLAVNGPGGSDMLKKEQMIEVFAPSPIARFGAESGIGTAPFVVQFHDSSLGDVDSWLWRFGDGETSGSLDPQHTYSDTGNYSVTLAVTGPGGQDSLTIQNMIRVTLPAPVAKFNADLTTGIAPLTVQFTDSSEGNVRTWQWEFGDGETSNLPNPSHVYTLEGTYTVQLIVTDPGGSDTLQIENFIQVQPGTSVAGGIVNPDEFRLFQNFPNPFNPVTTISYQVPAFSLVRVELFDVSGHPVILLFDGKQEAGYHQAVFDGSKLASGVYLCRIQIMDDHHSNQQMIKMTLLK